MREDIHKWQCVTMLQVRPSHVTKPWMWGRMWVLIVSSNFSWDLRAVLSSAVCALMTRARICPEEPMTHKGIIYINKIRRISDWWADIYLVSGYLACGRIADRKLYPHVLHVNWNHDDCNSLNNMVVYRMFFSLLYNLPLIHTYLIMIPINFR